MVKVLLEAIEAYRCAGGRAEHFALHERVQREIEELISAEKHKAANKVLETKWTGVQTSYTQQYNSMLDALANRILYE